MMVLEQNCCEVLSWKSSQWLMASTAGWSAGKRGAGFPCLEPDGVDMYAFAKELESL